MRSVFFGVLRLDVEGRFRRNAMAVGRDEGVHVQSWYHESFPYEEIRVEGRQTPTNLLEIFLFQAAW